MSNFRANPMSTDDDFHWNFGIALAAEHKYEEAEKELTMIQNEIYKMDLSTIEGLDAANTIVQAYDIIYVEPMPQLVRETTESLTPITSLISTLTFFYAFIVNPN